jgi:predicted nucleic acid-binding protein
MPDSELVLFDAGVLIGALLRGDLRHNEAYPLVEAARQGVLPACTTVGILSEVVAALTWINATPPQPPEIAANAVRLLVAPPSAIHLLHTDWRTVNLMLDLVAKHRLTARRVHDARYAATALTAGVTGVYTYDISDWQVFVEDGIEVIGPPSMIASRIVSR